MGRTRCHLYFPGDCIKLSHRSTYFHAFHLEEKRDQTPYPLGIASFRQSECDLRKQRHPSYLQRQAYDQCILYQQSPADPRPWTGQNNKRWNSELCREPIEESCRTSRGEIIKHRNGSEKKRQRTRHHGNDKQTHKEMGWSCFEKNRQLM